MRVWNWMPVLLNDLRMQLRGSRAALLLTVYVGLGLIAMRLVYNTVAGNLTMACRCLMPRSASRYLSARA
jgi:hypothetical protein